MERNLWKNSSGPPLRFSDEKKNNFLWICLGIFVLVVVLFLFYWYFLREPEPNEKPLHIRIYDALHQDPLQSEELKELERKVKMEMMKSQFSFPTWTPIWTGSYSEPFQDRSERDIGSILLLEKGNMEVIGFRYYVFEPIETTKRWTFRLWDDSTRNLICKLDTYRSVSETGWQFFEIAEKILLKRGKYRVTLTPGSDYDFLFQPYESSEDFLEETTPLLFLSGCTSSRSGMFPTDSINRSFFVDIVVRDSPETVEKLLLAEMNSSSSSMKIEEIM